MYFYGWNVVGAVFAMALFAFGLGFYGVAVYVATLQRLFGWSATAVAAPVTVYYVAGALVTASIGRVYERFGPRTTVVAGAAAMAAGLAALGRASSPPSLYPAFLAMALGWGAMSGAAINIILAPWWERRRGLAVSIAFNGATLGGVLIAPGLVTLIDALGFARALDAAALALLGVAAAGAAVMRRRPEEIGLGPDGGPPRPTPAVALSSARRSGWRDALVTWRFWSVSAPFALGLTAQVGVLTHLVAIAAPVLGTSGAARAVSAATGAALLGRLAAGLAVDRYGPRRVASVTLVAQAAGLSLIIWTRSPVGLYTGSCLFGLGVGNLTTLPGLILASEWSRERFSALVALAVGINQLTFAFGPTLVGVIRDRASDYGPALAACAALEMAAAAAVLLGPGRGERGRRVSDSAG